LNPAAKEDGSGAYAHFDVVTDILAGINGVCRSINEELAEMEIIMPNRKAWSNWRVELLELGNKTDSIHTTSS
jgi:hypothetical protein